MTTAAAQTPPGPYRIVRLDAPVADGNGFRDSAALGINHHGAVVGRALFPGFDSAQQPDGTPTNPFLWLPRPLYGLTSTGGLIRLAPFGDVSMGAGGEATDVNSSGDVVGEASSSTNAVTEPRAFLVSIDGTYGPAGQMLNLGVFNPATPGGGSRAEAVSDRGGPAGGPTPPIIVGGLSSTDFGPCDNSKANRGTGFVWTPLGGLQRRDGVPELPCGWIRGVAPDAVLSGGVTGSVRTETTTTFPCSESRLINGATWLSGTATPDLPLLPNAGGTLDESEALDVRNVGTETVIVGFVRENVSVVDCSDSAWKWTIDATGMVVGSPLPADPYSPGDQTRASALNHDQLIVGLNSTSERALIWTATACHRLDDLVDFSTAPEVAWVTSARDINDNGWIVGTGRITVDPQSPGIGYDAGVLLIPPNPCPGDVDWDGDVDATDLALVQTAPGGPCGVMWDACLPDVDEDGDVDGDDITFVLRYLKSGGCQTETLDPVLAQTWRAAGGDSFLQTDPSDAAAAVAAAYVPGDQPATFFNLIDLLGTPQ